MQVLEDSITILDPHNQNLKELRTKLETADKLQQSKIFFDFEIPLRNEN